MPDRMVFLSSTTKDLQVHREVVHRAIEQLEGYHCARMEDFGAHDATPSEFCAAKAADCDVLVLLVGHLYGSTPEGSDKSYTLLEYEAAREAQNPCLAFLAREDFPVPAKLREPDDAWERQCAFRALVSREYLLDFFDSSEDLARRAVQALHNWERVQTRPAPPSLIPALERLLWPDQASNKLTCGFRTTKHRELLLGLAALLEAGLDPPARVELMHSLNEAGCDIKVTFPDEGATVGLQLKSYRDICDKAFAQRTLAQMQDSRRHNLSRFYVLLAGDLTDTSQHEKIRALQGRVSEMNDDYVMVVPPERLWTLVGKAGAAPAEAAPPSPPPKPQVPKPRALEPRFAHVYPLPKGFTGRVTERRMLTDWLLNGAEQVLALTAIGGMGKSALTWAWVLRDVLGLDLPGAAADLPETTAVCRVPEEDRPDGVFWWSFYETQASFGDFLEDALDYLSNGHMDAPAGRQESKYDKMRRLVRLLRQRRVVMILDGFERQLGAYANLGAPYQGDRVGQELQGDFRKCADPDASDFLARIVCVPMQSRILITSRLFPRELDGMAGCRPLQLTGLSPENAHQFFVAQNIQATREEVQEVCEQYGYHPLAMRLLAGVITHDPQRLGDFQVATDQHLLADLVSREHHILQVAYDSLSEQQKEVLGQLSAFRSPVEYDALRLLRQSEPEQKTRDILLGLAQRGLVQVKEELRCYDLHPIVRQYAYYRLRDKRGVHTRLRDYFAAVPEAEKVESLTDLAPVIELYHHTVRAGRFDEARDLYRDRLNKPLYYRFGAYQTCIELLRSLFPDGEDKPPRLKNESDQAWTLNALANSCSLSGQPRRAVPLFEMHTALREKEGSKVNVAIGLGNLANRNTELGELAAAERNLRRSIALCREIKNEFQEAVGHQNLGRLLAYEGAFDRADGELDTALASFTQLGAPQSQCVVWAYRALRALLKGDAPAALDAARKTRELADIFHPGYGKIERDIIRAEWLLGWAHVALALDDKPHKAEHLAEAEAHLTEALIRCRRINLVDHEPDILLAWARWHRTKGDSESARAVALDALSIANRAEYRLVQADCRNLLARLALDSGDASTARKEAEIAREHAWCDGPGHAYKPALDEADRLLAQL